MSRLPNACNAQLYSELDTASALYAWNTELNEQMCSQIALHMSTFDMKCKRVADFQ
ncbi:hypothetical protein DPMN_189268 [Dreissena polymorpha]|uniref:Uncharacterized protein n=1 Tax=Dreissena polymorpha TaxID=45954 RepID=A0A9D4DU14_DREPO|nr:hypothetical protein DPMN_189268 [Dreissena polymorpha]